MSLYYLITRIKLLSLRSVEALLLFRFCSMHRPLKNANTTSAAMVGSILGCSAATFFAIRLFNFRWLEAARHLAGPPGIAAAWLPNRTGAPLISESAGSSTTASLAWSPEITSTVLP